MVFRRRMTQTAQYPKTTSRFQKNMEFLKYKQKKYVKTNINSQICLPLLCFLPSMTFKISGEM